MTDARIIDLAYIARMAPIWRDRPPSGRYILHRLPCDRHCPRHGAVTKVHLCKTTHPQVCGDIGVARSAWMGPPSWMAPIQRRGGPGVAG